MKKIVQFEVANQTGELWALTDDGRLWRSHFRAEDHEKDRQWFPVKEIPTATPPRPEPPKAFGG